MYQSKIMVISRNFQQAVEYIKKAVAVDPKYWPGYKGLGELYYDNQKYTDAVANFEIYFRNVPVDKDITHYAYSLFFNKQYQQARDMIDKLIQQNPNDYVLLRLLGYISFETKDLVNGKVIMDKYFKLVPNDKILTDDYAYYGKMLSASNLDSLAIETYHIALKRDSTQYQLLDELSKSCMKLKKYDEALKYSSDYIKKKPNVTTADYFQLGRAFYSSANNIDVKTDSLKQLSYYHSADSLFAKVETYSPNSYLGPFWRGRVNSVIDKETTLGLAKPFYEKALEILVKDPVKNKKEVSEVYAYLGFYYYVKDDTTTSIEYWKKLLEIDPENLKAQEAIKSLEKKK
jgi:tetratricopeptide (TPR) repeat protein